MSIGSDWRGALQHEWVLLQAEHEQSERTAAWLKGGAVLLCFASLAVGIDLLPAVLLVLVLWLQEGIVRTVQSRVAERLLRIESLLRASDGNPGDAFQLHSSWQQQRPGALALCLAYIRHAGRPTVAYPYIVLVAILFISWLLPVAG